MTKGRVAAWTITLLLVAGAVTAAFILLPRWYAGADQPSGEQAAAPPAAATPKIKAHLFYLSDDGLHLVQVEREVPVGQGVVQQARRLVEAQLEAPAKPQVSAIPEGTKLRALYVDAEGQAFVDLSREVASAHSGGVLDEVLTVYSIVNAITANLPAVHGVQILVDGREVDTLAGHVDLRRPLARSAAWVLDPGPMSPVSGGLPAAPEKQ